MLYRVIRLTSAKAALDHRVRRVQDIPHGEVLVARRPLQDERSRVLAALRGEAEDWAEPGIAN